MKVREADSADVVLKHAHALSASFDKSYFVFEQTILPAPHSRE